MKMGIFDRVVTKCPVCGGKLEFHSTEGKCKLKRHNQTSVPPEIALDLSGEFGDTEECCGTEWKLIETSIPKRINMSLVPINE